MNLTRAPNLWWIWPPSQGKTDKSAMEGGGVPKPVRGRDVNRPVVGTTRTGTGLTPLVLTPWWLKGPSMRLTIEV